MAEPFSNELRNEAASYRRNSMGRSQELALAKLLEKAATTIDADRKRIGELEAENEQLKKDIAEQDEIDRIAESGKEEKKKLPGWKDIREILKGNKENQ